MEPRIIWMIEAGVPLRARLNGEFSCKEIEELLVVFKSYRTDLIVMNGETITIKREVSLPE